MAPTAAAVEKADVGGRADWPVSTIPSIAMGTGGGTAITREMKKPTVTTASKVPENRTDGDSFGYHDDS